MNLSLVEGTRPAPFNIDELLNASAYPHPISHHVIRETNISWVILTGYFAYKIKKPVRLAFLDTLTLKVRHELCEEELRLNRRLAPSLYLAVVPITREPHGLKIGGTGRILEYAVKMREFDGSQELCNLLTRGNVTADELQELAGLLAESHGSAPVAPQSRDFQHTHQLRDAVLGNLATLLANLGPINEVCGVGRLIDWTHDELHDLAPHLESREQCGFIRECHGDLHARNIVRWQGKLVPFDCLEFDPQLRWIDVMNDVAFLVMDLVSHERVDLAYAFLNRYLEITGDYAGVRLLRFYSIYRALVRATVDALADDVTPTCAKAMHRRLEKRVDTAVKLMDRPAPVLILMHGVSGSGKSWLSLPLADSLGAIRIRSDLERKRLAKIPALADASADVERGIYSPEISDRTYARLLDCAQSCLQGGMNTIVDAAFLRKEDRRLFCEFARLHRMPCVIVACDVDPLTAARRIRARKEGPMDASDAGIRTLQWQFKSADPIGEDEMPHVITCRTSDHAALSKTLGRIRDRIGSWHG